MTSSTCRAVSSSNSKQFVERPLGVLVGDIHDWMKLRDLMISQPSGAEQVVRVRANVRVLAGTSGAARALT